MVPDVQGDLAVIKNRFLIEDMHADSDYEVTMRVFYFVKYVVKSGSATRAADRSFFHD